MSRVNANAALSVSDTKSGFALGAGLEWKWDAHWMLRGEHRYVQFDGVSGTAPQLVSAVPAFPAQTNCLIWSGQFKENIGRVAVSYKF